jgi:two-component system, sensor histidine kinase PdtaS
MSSISIEAYLAELVGDLIYSSGRVGSNVELQTRITEVDLDLETCVVLCLIVTELASNSLKHAFPENWAGEISLGLKEIDDSTLELSVADDGVGLPQNVQLDKPNTLGLDLVNILSRQLNSHIETRGMAALR